MNRFLVVLFTLLGVFATSCNSEDEENGNSAVLGTWEITSIKISAASLTQRPPSGETISISFSDDGTFSGSTPNNTFSGSYAFEGTNTLTFVEFSASEAEDTIYGQAFFNAVDNATATELETTQFGYIFDGGDLIFFFGDQGQMVLEK